MLSNDDFIRKENVFQLNLPQPNLPQPNPQRKLPQPNLEPNHETNLP